MMKDKAFNPVCIRLLGAPGITPAAADEIERASRMVYNSASPVQLIERICDDALLLSQKAHYLADTSG